MSITDLENKKLTDIHNDCVFIQAITNEVQEQMRVILPDLSKKIDTDNCGTISNKTEQFNAVLNGLSSLSTVADVADNLIEATNGLLKK
jgi:hypothetical protein